MHFELERCFMMPRESSTMQLIMTSLLSTPFQRLKLDKKNLMPYKVWEQKLRLKLESWYKTYNDSDNDVEKACNKLGLDEQFFEIVGCKNAMERKRYHELSFYRKVWIMKSLCDHCLHVQDSLRETVEIQPAEDQREFLLGTDNNGQRYIHFPQFCGADVRVYRQAPVKYPKIEIKPDPFESKRKYPFVYKPPPLKKVKLKKKRHKTAVSKSVSETPSPVASPLRQRPTRLRQAPKSVVPLQLQEDASVTEGTGSSSSEEDNTGDISNVEPPEPVPGTSTELDPVNAGVNNDVEKEQDSRSVDQLSSGSDATLPYCDNSDSNSNTSSRDCSRDSSPYPSCSDLSMHYSSRIDRSSDLSQESSPCPSPGDFGNSRRSAKFDRYSDTSRDASPLIFDSDFGLRRSSRNRARLKNIPPLRAARDLSNFLFDENSASNSSLAGDNSSSGLGSSLFKDTLTSRRSSKSSEVTEDSNDCDIQVNKLFTNSKTSNSAVIGQGFHKVLLNEDNEMNENFEDDLNKSGLFGKRVLQTDIVKSKQTAASDSNVSVSESTTDVHQNSSDVHDNDATRKDAPTAAGSVSSRITEEDKDFNDNAIISNSDSANEDINMAEEIDQSENENNTNLEIELSSQNAACNNTEHSLYSDNELTGNSYNINNVEYSHGDSEDVKVKFENDLSETANGMNDDASASSMCELKTERFKEELVDASSDLQTNLMKFENVKAECKDELTIKHEHQNGNDDKNITDIKDIKPDSDSVADFKDSEVGRSDRKTDIKEEFINGSDVKAELESAKTEKDEEDLKHENNEIKQEKQEESENEEDEILPDSSQFEMIADSVEELRKLSVQFAEPEPIVIRRGKKEQIQRAPPRKKNIVILHERIEYLLKELEPWESKLQQASRRARLRMRKEMEDYMLKPPEQKTEDWKSSDEETESGESDGDEDTSVPEKPRTKPYNDDKTSAANSRCSTPIKPPEEVEEIDISHRGRLRKRRIIPNNVEDQLAIKKPKAIKSETSQSLPTSSQPVIVQSSKTQLVDYADIIRQLKNSGGNAPILIKTTQGGRTVLTSVLPVNVTNNSFTTTTTTQNIQTVRIVSPGAGSMPVVSSQFQPQALKIAVSGSGIVSATSKALQHPTIQNLLSGTVAGTKLLTKTSAAVSPVPVTGNGISVAQSTVSYPPTPEKMNMQKVVPAIQTTPQKLSLSPIATPRKIAPHTTASISPGKPKAKYYAANASTLPINVVQQLIATRGAKLSHGAYKQSILLIPMENEGQSRNVVSSAAVVTAKNQLQTVSGPQVSPGSMALTLDSSTLVSTAHSAPKSSPNTLILPKPDVGSTSQVLTLAQALPGIQIQPGLTGLQRHRAFLQPAVVDGLNVTRLVHVGIPPKSPTRYPTNETVKTLLEKRKPMDSVGTKILNVLNDTSGSMPSVKVTSNQSPQISPVYMDPINTKMEMQTAVGAAHSSVSPVAKAIPIASMLDTARNEGLITTTKPQQCVITSISAAKLNTLLLQTSAAGAKTIPSLIKLPSKAALDSAVKAVVTSVNITLPTVNIKVPSPTSLPSIGPRRNVTKTIQTMKSPIPVAPKVVTQSSGGQTILSCADSHAASSSMMLAASAPSTISCNNSMSATHSMQTISGTHVVQGQDGKRVMGKITPQLLLTSKGVVQMGYMSPEGLLMKSPIGDSSQVGVQFDGTSAVQTGNQGMNQAVLVQNSAGQYQLIHQANSALHQTTLAANLQQLASPSAAVSQCQGQTMLQGVQPMVALNASGNPVLLPTVKPNTQVATNSSPPSIVLHNSTYYAAPRKPAPLSLARTSPTLGSSGLVGAPAVAGASDLKATTPGFVIQQPTSAILQPSPSSIISQAGLVSPLLNLQQGLQQGLVLQGGGVQLAGNSLVNPVGLNLLQSGLALQNTGNLQVSAASPGLNLLQKAVSANTGQQLLNINPLLLNSNLSTTTGGVLNQQQNGRSVIGQVSPSVTNLTTSVPRLNINAAVKPPTDGATLQVKGLTGIRPTLATTLPATSLVSPVPQMMQVQGSSLIIPNLAGANQQLNLLGQLSATPNTAQKQLVFQYPSVSQLVTQTAAINQLPIAATSKGKVLVSPGNKQSVTSTAARLSVPQMSTRSEPPGNGTVAVNQVPVNIGQRTSPTQQKLLLFSIGGQLVTGHGVPVTLCDGVLKVVPHGKIKINNQTLTSEQIKQTLAKINEAAAMTLNPSSQQQAQVQQTGSNNVSDQSKVIPVKIVKDSMNVASGPCVAAVDHSYQNMTKDKVVSSLMNGNTGNVSISPFQKSSETHNSVGNHSNSITPNIQTGVHVVKTEPNSEPQLVDQSKDQTLIMKPMVYSSGFVVQQRNSDQVEVDMKPGSANQNYNIGKLVVDKDAKGFLVKAPVKGDLSGYGDASNSVQNHVIKLEMKANTGDDEEDETDNKLVIDDSVSEKEAALNLLTLANQALAPIKTEEDENNSLTS